MFDCRSVERYAGRNWGIVSASKEEPMNRKSELVPRTTRRKQRRAPAPALGAGLLLALLAIALWVAPGASAAETIYWANYTGGTIGFANLDGSGGGQLNTGGQEVDEPEGMAIDSAAGRLYWANYTGGPGGAGAIRYANLDGSGGGGELDTGGAEVQNPNGVAVDPATRTIYWANNSGGPSGKGSISFAKLDGGGAGQLNIAGATLDSPLRVAIDPTANRLYWANDEAGTSSIAWARLDGSGGGDLDLSGATPPVIITGLSVDPAAGRIYWVDPGLENVSYANLGGGGGGDVGIGGATFESPYGLALDPTAARIYWGNYDNAEVRAGAIGFADLGGGGGGLNIATAPVNGPQDPVILKGPSGVAAPSISGATTPGSTLSCSQGTWADFPGSFVYQAPRTYAYQWSRNGAPIGGAVSSTQVAALPGAYTCAVTASNQNGSATQTSAQFQVAAPLVPVAQPARLKMAVRPKRARARAGKKAAKYKVWVTNFGGLPATGVRVCVRKQQKPKKAKRRARKALKAPKCRKLGTIAPGATRSKVRVNVWARRRARGTYRLRFVVRGGGGAKPVTRKLVAKKHKKGNRHRKRGG
jgi:6-phosphogluconolactonase (cycloisomerase 2 family)